jgi:5-methylcytosine-specific restriction endonuclease McrA
LRQNPEKSAAYSRKYRIKNKGNRNLWTANYRSAKDERQPSWLNAGHLFEMESIYNYCAALRSAGLDYHVDHIVPLRGNTVSGLHVPWNLQVITGAENMSKGNCFNG